VPDTSPAPALGAPDTWVAPLARALPVLVLGLVVTFSKDHSASFGLVAFGVFAIVTAAVLLASGLRADRPVRGLVLTQGVVTAIAGIAALVLPSGGVGYLVPVVSAWAIVAGFLETVNGIRFRRTRPAARDWLASGVITVLLGLVFLLTPQNYIDDYAVEDGAGGMLTGAVTADILLVGVLGAWAIIQGVLLAIAAVSLRTPRAEPAKTVSE
jgi:uncharacterized membrane protein HdeD (DUF308 family)